MSGFSTSCGCRWSRAKDLREKRFGLLIAIEPVAEKAKDGSIKWKCKCDCGGETIVSSNKLLQNHTTSCGCKGIVEARNAKTYVDGTCLELLFSSKLRKNNTSGHTGVSMKRGRWIAYINVSKKKYSLGSFDTLEEAAKARKNAEIYWKKRLIGEE